MTEPTYAGVAQWLPTDVREAIENTLPCPAGGAHDWQHDRTEIRKFGELEPVLIYEHWLCRCGLIRSTDPGESE